MTVMIMSHDKFVLRDDAEDFFGQRETQRASSPGLLMVASELAVLNCRSKSEAPFLKALFLLSVSDEEMKVDDFGIAVAPVATLPAPLFRRWAFYYLRLNGPRFGISAHLVKISCKLTRDSSK